MNVLLINHYAGSPAYGMEYRPYYLAREWIRLGHNVTVVAATASHVRTVQPQIIGAVTLELVDGIHYLWLKTPIYHGNGVRRVANILTFVALSMRYLPQYCTTFSPDIVIGSSTYPLDMTVVNYLAHRHQATSVYEVHDLWPLSLIELGGMSPLHPFVVLIQWGENYAYRHADYVVSMLPCAKEHMQAHGMAPAKFVHIPNGVVTEEWQSQGAPLPETHSQIFDELKAQNRFIVGYVGAHGVANCLHSLIEAAAALADTHATILLVGQGPEKDGLMQLAQRLQTTNVIFLPPVPKAVVPNLMAEIDVAYIGLQRQPLFRFGVSPNKLMDYMMSAKPVINAVEAGNDLVAESRCGISIAAEDPRAVADAIRTMQALSAEEREQMGRNGRRYVVDNHDYAVLARRFLADVDKPR